MTELDDRWNEKFHKDNDTEQPEPRIEISYDDWQHALIEKYQKLYDIVKENLPNLWDSLDFELSIQKILNIKDCTLPFAGILLGRPSSMKTVGIGMFRKWKHSFYTDNFSAKAFVSHSTAVKKQELEQIDLLPKIRNKLFLTPELSPTFTKKDDDLIEILGILTRVLDGQGYESDTGAHGHRGYHGEYMFVWIGAAVDIPWKVHKFLGTLGPKLYFLRLPNTDRKENEYLDQIDTDDFIVKTNLIQGALIDYLDWFEKCPEAITKDGIAKIKWNYERDDNETKRFIVRLGILLARLRGIIPTWETRDSQGIDYSYTFATIEDPERAIHQLRNLARGHALSRGRNYITMDDISLVINVVFSTASTERVNIFESLLNFGGKLTTSQITDYLNTSSNTAKRTMAELKALGIVKITEIQGKHGGSPEKQMVLDDKFKWFLSGEFKQLRDKAQCKNFTTLLVKERTTQHCILDDDKRGGGNFSYPANDEQSKDEYPPDCYYCDEDFDGIGKQGYEKHVLDKHQKMVCYPGPADIELYDLTPKGIWWEAPVDRSEDMKKFLNNPDSNDSD